MAPHTKAHYRCDLSSWTDREDGRRTGPRTNTPDLAWNADTFRTNNSLIRRNGFVERSGDARVGGSVHSRGCPPAPVLETGCRSFRYPAGRTPFPWGSQGSLFSWPKGPFSVCRLHLPQTSRWASVRSLVRAVAWRAGARRSGAWGQPISFLRRS